ncbi:MAG: queuosine precursor transporter [Patescibacteria group bacterium]|nr:queuosine precursor transporter [Patescibacteria group bacterium]
MIFNRNQLPSRRELLTVGFIVAYVIANIVSVKFVKFMWLNLPAGTLLYPLTFLFTGVLCELYGKKAVQRIIWLGFYANLIVLLLIKFSIWLTPADFWKNTAAFNLIMDFAPKVILASIIAYLVAQSNGVWIFSFLKERTKGKYLWLRNNAATIIGQLLDTVILIVLLMWFGVIPAATAWTIIGSHFMVKTFFSLIGTPFCYLLAWRRQTQNNYQTINKKIPYENYKVSPVVFSGRTKG